MFEDAIRVLKDHIDFLQNQIDVYYFTVGGVKKGHQKIKECKQAISILKKAGNGE